jgi:hypothetical protein
MNRTVAIHQPNFFPWLGYFSKIERSDVFVFFDDVQFPKTGGGCWSNRVKLLIDDQARWATAAIERNFHGTRSIQEMRLLASNPWREKLLRNLELNYRRHPYFTETIEFIAPLLLNSEANMAEYNIRSITMIAGRLGLDTNKVVRSSSLPHEGRSNELLCSITKLLGGNSYMSGGGAEGYQDETIFNAQSIILKDQKFIHPIYLQQRREFFVAGLSIIDALMNVGWNGTRQLLTNPTC